MVSVRPQTSNGLFNKQPFEVTIDPWAEQVRRAARSGVYRWVLEHIPDVAPVVVEVGRVLMPGGRFIFTVPSDAFHQLLYRYCLRQRAGDRRSAEAYAAEVDARLAHYHYHSLLEWAEILARGGMVLEKARYYIPEAVEHLWDPMNHSFGIGRRSLWGLPASPRLRSSPHQRWMARWVIRNFSRTWRPWYEMDVPEGQKGGGLLIVGRKEG